MDKCVDRHVQTKSVLIISHMYPRERAPVNGIFVHEQVKALRAAGIDARVMTGEPYWLSLSRMQHLYSTCKDYFSWPRAWVMYDGVPVLKFPYLAAAGVIPFAAHARTYTLGAMNCVRFLKHTFPIDLIHAHTAFVDGTAGAKLAARFRVPLVITEHTGPFSTLTKTRILRRQTQTAINKSSQLISVSHALLNDISAQINLKFPHKTTVIPNTINTNIFYPTMTISNTNNRINMLWVGHFVPVKRVPVLLQALSLAIKAEPLLYLRLIGTGDGKNAAEQLVRSLNLQEFVEFIGYADQSTLAGFYQRSDFLVVASESETFSMVAAEALCCGCPVLSTNCGGPADIITDERLGLLVDKSVESLAAGMQTMSRNLDKFAPQFIHNVAQARYSYAAVSSSLLDVYSDLLYSS